MNEVEPACPAPAKGGGGVTLAHGAGGRLTHRLVEEVFLRRFPDPALLEAHDGAVLSCGVERVAFTTDSFVVRPLFFPGGDIGTLAVCGTANDLAMCGAEPLFLSCAVILEEGFPLAELDRVAASLARAAGAAGLRLVTGDTKVVERGKGDGVYVTTSGLGRVAAPRPVRPAEVRPGDAIVLSGDVGRHAAAILSVREGLAFDTRVRSDCACVWPQVRGLLDAGVTPRCLRDLTRGGLATALNEVAQAAKVGLRVDEDAVPVEREVAAAAELFGLDPLYMACEGRFAAFVPPEQAQAARDALARLAPGQAPAVIGEARAAQPGEVRLRGRLGVERMLDMLSGEQLPRIC
ncbi:MAG: hydrogenase expression/formation protein HypE [Elusimicrobia bacterium]|nr:hydrogenase expression/formation protein HypE [Elusimicrobiota bacterium]